MSKIEGYLLTQANSQIMADFYRHEFIDDEEAVGLIGSRNSNHHHTTLISFHLLE